MLSFTMLEPVRHFPCPQQEEGLGPLAIYHLLVQPSGLPLAPAEGR